MSNPATQLPHSPDYLATLNQFLNLAMHAAQTASAEADHRLVLQAIREGTRIIALINKMTNELTSKSMAEPKSAQPPNRACHSGNPNGATQTGKREKSGKTAGKIPLLSNVFTLFQDDSQSKKNAGKNSQFDPQTKAGPSRPDNQTPWTSWFAPHAKAYVSGLIDLDTMLELGKDMPIADLEAALEAASASAKG
jgi:hypothetical protein